MFNYLQLTTIGRVSRSFCAIAGVALLVSHSSVSAQEAPPLPSDDCLAAAGGLIGTTPTGSGWGAQAIHWDFMPGTPQSMREGKTRWSYASYGGVVGGEHIIQMFTANWIRSQPDGTVPPPVTAADVENCSPNALALLIAITAHELLHGPGGCGGHESPDCAGIAIDIGVAGILCEIIIQLNECFCDPGCPPLDGLGGNPIPGLDTDADICALAAALCDRHKEIADRNNSDEGKKKAATCHCDGWSGGPNCPSIPAPAGGCPPSSAPDGGFGSGPVVPPCQGCPPCQCP